MASTRIGNSEFFISPINTALFVVKLNLFPRQKLFRVLLGVTVQKWDHEVEP